MNAASQSRPCSNNQVTILDPASGPASAAQASKSLTKSTASDAPVVSDTFSDVLDVPSLRDTLWQAIGASTDERTVRAATVTVLKDAQASGRAAISARLDAQPRNALPVTTGYTWLTDQLVGLTFEIVTERIHRNPNPTEGERMAVLAVGGYGRGEMAPFSDVDLLFLTPYKITAWAESVIESMLYILWDLKLKVGHSSRTVKDCLRLGAEDFTIRTAMLEHRFLVGHEPLADDLDGKLWKTLFRGTEVEFVEAKLAERDARHVKQGQRYMVEPNVKEGKGGLRDLQSLFWIAKYIHHTDDLGKLVRAGVFQPEEFDTFVKAENFLWAVRCHLHLASGRATEQLTFDMQVEVADRMGYVDKGGRRGVEIFMQDFFRHATSVGDLTRIFLTSLEASQQKEPPLLMRLLKRAPKIKDGHEVVNGRLGIVDNAAFLADKINLLRIFEEALRTGLLIHADAMRLISANLHLIDTDMRNTKEAQRIFLDLLLKHGNPERALRRMNELGVLSAFIPEFEPIVAMMQFNMYHHYTVDEHTIQCIWHLSEIENGNLVEELPVASSILKHGVNRKVLYVALLLHDIGKGRDEDHSILGAKIARKVAPQLGLNKQECATVEWLVRYHLLMSDMAQKRDIADPRTVRDFAKAVQTRERLDLLCVLTVCDIRGVGPGTWNNWQAVLIRALLPPDPPRTRGRDGGAQPREPRRRGQESPARRPRRLGRTRPAHRNRPPLPAYWQGLHITAHKVFAKLLRDIGDDEIRIDIHPDEDRDATRSASPVRSPRHLLTTRALALVGANVVDARTFTSKDGFATAAFWIQDGDGSPYEDVRIPRLRDTISKTLRGDVVPREAMKPRDKIKKRERAFKVPTSITFDNEGSEIYTIIEVDTRDRPGLLFDLTRTLANANVYIASAVIATYGEQVVDTFYVKDMFGLKFHSQSKQKALETKLRSAISEGAARAKE